MRPGDVFNGAFRIERKLGEGGFAAVYSAVDPNGQLVALKILQPDNDGSYEPTTRQRFEREVDLVRRLESPHVVRLFDAGEAQNGALFAVFEHVPGRDLSELLHAVGRLDARWVLHILRQLLLALREAHGKGLLHRDIKPENVRVFERWDNPMFVKLLDFGIARATDHGHPALTRTGEMLGTPKYMSPEQLLDQPLTAASDLYSLGLMAFELAVGREMTGGAGWGAQLERLQSGHILSYPEMDRIGPELLSVLQRMTARQAPRRFQSVNAALAAIDRIGPSTSADVSGLDATAAPAATAPDQLPPPRQTTVDDSGRLVPIAIVLVLMVAAAAVAVHMLREPTTRPVPATVDVQALLKSSEPAAKAPAVQPAEDSPVDAGHDMAPLGTVLPPEDPRGGTAGCGKEPPFRGYNLLRGKAGYLTYIPQGYRNNYKHPVIFLLHQDQELPTELLPISGFAELSEPDRFIVIAPEHPNPLSAWRDDEDDVQIVRDAYELAARRLCLDPKRVFAVGNAQGGRAAHFLSCEDWIAGIGTHAFGSGNSSHHCRREDPPLMPFVVITPTDSPHTPIHGGPSCTPFSIRMPDDDDHQGPPQKFSAREIERMWRIRNHCTDEPPVVRRDGPHTCYTWSCEALVHSCHVDGGHGWPGSTPRTLRDFGPCSGPPPTDFALAAEFWRAFRGIGQP